MGSGEAPLGSLKSWWTSIFLTVGLALEGAVDGPPGRDATGSVTIADAEAVGSLWVAGMLPKVLTCI